MKRLHIHLAVPDLEAAIHFYSSLFGAAPDKTKGDYAKWQLSDPLVNFAISTRSEHYGLDHLGIQVEEEVELEQIQTRLGAAGIENGEANATTCCYAESVKSWSFDPAGIPWESFVTMADAEVYGADNPQASRTDACCGTESPATSRRCC